MRSVRRETKKKTEAITKEEMMKMRIHLYVRFNVGFFEVPIRFSIRRPYTAKPIMIASVTMLK